MTRNPFPYGRSDDGEIYKSDNPKALIKAIRAMPEAGVLPGDLGEYTTPSYNPKTVDERIEGWYDGLFPEQHFQSKDLERQPELARRICEEAHAGQTRWNKEPYHNHPHRIADSFKDPLAKAVAELHDVLEDCPEWTAQRLIAEGVFPEVVTAVIILTKIKNEKYAPYIKRVMQSRNNLAITVKLADLRDNLSDLHEYPDTKMKIDRYELAQALLSTVPLYPALD